MMEWNRGQVRVPGKTVVSEDGAVISCRDLGKCYRVYRRPSDRLLEGAGRAVARWRGSVPRVRGEEVWALRDLSFDVHAGETVGIVGRNGSGKSTLLQLVTGILQPTTGSVAVHGRIAALLELGAGFNQQFTGRENARLNARLLGLSEAELRDREDDILAFADIGEFIDRPVTTYSTGMVVRVAFAVAVSVDPDVLIVDEALAVGDAAFQAKCMARIRRMQERGVTLLFVSHDVGAVRALCRRALYLDHGRLVEQGDATSVVDRYLRDTHTLMQEEAAPATPRPATAEGSVPLPLRERVGAFEAELRSERHGSGEARVRLVELLDERGAALEIADFDQRVLVRIAIQAATACAISVNYKIRDRYLVAVTGADFLITGTELLQLEPGGWYIVEYWTRLPLMAGDYSLRVSLTIPINRHEQAQFVDVIEIMHPFRVLPAVQGRIYTQVFLPHDVAVTRLTEQA
jgi:lipopolysaccharide transport system ATP-binding protein